MDERSGGFGKGWHLRLWLLKVGDEVSSGQRKFSDEPQGFGLGVLELEKHVEILLTGKVGPLQDVRDVLVVSSVSSTPEKVFEPPSRLEKVCGHLSRGKHEYTVSRFCQKHDDRISWNARLGPREDPVGVDELGPMGLIGFEDLGFSGVGTHIKNG